MSYKSVTKYSLRIQYGMSQTTLQKVMNERFFTELEKEGYKKSMKIIPPRVLKKLFELFGEPIHFDLHD